MLCCFHVRTEYITDYILGEEQDVLRMHMALAARAQGLKSMIILHVLTHLYSQSVQKSLWSCRNLCFLCNVIFQPKLTTKRSLTTYNNSSHGVFLFSRIWFVSVPFEKVINFLKMLWYSSISSGISPSSKSPFFADFSYIISIDLF